MGVKPVPVKEADAMRLPLSIALAVIVIGGALRPASSLADPHADAPIGFEAPELILDGSEYGLLNPAFADIDGDGKTDLLVGVHSGDNNGIHGVGRLLVYGNRGTNARPVYAKPTWFDETVPSARIPDS
jgi:FG-GAP repeat